MIPSEPEEEKLEFSDAFDSVLKSEQNTDKKGCEVMTVLKRWAVLYRVPSKAMLPYQNLGSGIKRALDKWQDINFANDRKSCLLTGTVHQKRTADVGQTLISGLENPFFESSESSPVFRGCVGWVI